MLNRNFKEFPLLATKRLRLRKLDAEDALAILNLRSDLEVNKFLNRKIAHNLDDARQFINVVNNYIDTNSSIYWAISFKDSKELVGTIGLFGFSEEEQKCEIGYELLTKFQGQGILFEAAEQVIKYAFEKLGVNLIEAIFHRDNLRSINLLEKLSFEKLDTISSDLMRYYLNSSKDKH